MFGVLLAEKLRVSERHAHCTRVYAAGGAGTHSSLRLFPYYRSFPLSTSYLLAIAGHEKTSVYM